jgi:SpoVK/Ycf46/Vps4 family AAA+-type ATPase
LLDSVGWALYRRGVVSTSHAMRPRFLSTGSQQRIRLVGGSSSTQRFRAAKSRARLSGKDVLRVDLSMILGKYIGETERNIRRLMDEAERANAVLYFDEADELLERSDQTGTGKSRVPNARNALTSAARRRHITVITGKAARPGGAAITATPDESHDDESNDD